MGVLHAAEPPATPLSPDIKMMHLQFPRLRLYSRMPVTGRPLVGFSYWTCVFLYLLNKWGKPGLRLSQPDEMILFSR
jgi:hypothetical protein